jgi:hypothetical protein
MGRFDPQNGSFWGVWRSPRPQISRSGPSDPGIWTLRTLEMTCFGPYLGPILGPVLVPTRCIWGSGEALGCAEIGTRSVRDVPFGTLPYIYLRARA